MRLAKMFRLRLRSAFSRSNVEQELDEELRYHLDRQIEENIAAGMSRKEARQDALRSMQDFEQRKEECRDMRGFNLIDNLLHDLRFAVRQLWKTPGFTGTAILMLALGMCASVAIFAFVDAALLKPLPYQNSSRLVGVFESVKTCPQCNLSYLDYLDWKKSNNVFSSLDVYQGNGSILSTPEGAQRAFGARVSDGFFRTLGVRPLLGRDFYAGEDLPAAPRTVLLSYAVWQNRYGGKREALGQTVTLDGVPKTIIGVLPPDFHFAPIEPVEYWTTVNVSGSCEQRRGCHNLYGVARLNEGVSLQTALANVTLVAQQLQKQYPDTNRDQGAALSPLSEVIVGNIRPILLVLLSGAALLLLISCVNIASLLLVRCEARRREMAVRSALGASAARLFLQFVTEGLVLVVAGSALGLASARLAMQLLTKLIPARMLATMPFMNGLTLNFHVLIFACSIAVLAAMLFSFTPALRLSSSALRSNMAEGSRGSAGNTWRRLGSKLVVVELATAMVLLVGAGLLGKSFYLLLRVNIGMQSDHLVTLGVAAPGSSYSKAEQSIALQHEVMNRIGSLPGVESVGLVSQIPVSNNGNTWWFRVVGRPFHGEHNEVPERDVSPGYFATVKAKLIRGRYFTEADDASKPLVVIVNSAMVRQYFPGEDPIGKQVVYLTDPPRPMEIVGIVDDIKEGQLDTATPPVVYRPYNQDASRFFSVVVRTPQAEQSQFTAVTAAIRQIDTGIVTAGILSMSERINNSPAAYLHRSSAWLVGGFAALALLLGVIGLYGVIAYSVSQRTREIGVRMALGAQPRSVYQLVLKEAGWLTIAGVVAGLLCSLCGASLMRTLLFGTPPWDVPTLAAVAVVLSISALLASYIPARRAASVNPVDALRAE
jgi:macrolide transport system ATP-binding/permease protein